MRVANRRVLFVTWGFEPGPVGGAERQARLQASRLIELGYHVEVVCPRERDVPRRHTVGAIPVTRLPLINRRPFRRITFLATLFVFCLRHLNRFDLVHVHLANLQVDVVGLAARMRSTPVWVKVACGGRQGEAQRLSKVAWLTRWYGLRHAARVQAISDEIAEEMKHIVGVDPSHLIRIPNGVDTTEYRPASDADRRLLRQRLRLPGDRILVLFLGRLAAYKGLDTLLAAWDQLDVGDQALLVVAGPPAIDAPIEVSALSRPNVQVLPQTSRPMDYFRAADAFVNPARADGMSNSLLEAMASGLPVISSATGASPELLRHGDAGLLVPPGDVTALRAALAALIGSPVERSRLGSASLDAVQAYAIASVVGQIEAEYQRILAGTVHVA